MGRNPTRCRPDHKAIRDRMHDTLQNREMQPLPWRCHRLLPHCHELRILRNMISLVTHYTLRPFATALALLFIGMLFWCGDAECWSGTNPDQCGSLLCALFGPHESSSPVHDDTCSHDCTCACHTPVLAPPQMVMLQEFRVELASFEYIAATPVSSLPLVYHPPRG